MWNYFFGTNKEQTTVAEKQKTGPEPVFMDLVDNAVTEIPIPGTTTYGSYMIIVTSVDKSGTSAIFMLAGNEKCGGNGTCVSSGVGSKDETLDIVWDTGDQPRLKWNGPPKEQTGKTYRYAVHVITT